MKEINPASAAFILWVKEELRKPNRLQTLKDETFLALEEFFDKSDQEITDLLIPKLEQGSRDHGAPYYHPHSAQQELVMEYLDLLGWRLIGQWSDRLPPNLHHLKK